jgi:hypothetical protein
VCKESKAAISGVVEVEKSSSEVVRASSEAEMLSRFFQGQARLRQLQQIFAADLDRRETVEHPVVA